ncbi:MAG: UbiA-like polyprenyltransferase [Bacteroidota bacterium]|nr:UbiA-like polyprenyltransferase [Bacteroidota bacterium]
MKKYLSLIKFTHTIFAMPFALIGFFIAIKSHPYEWQTIIYIILCMIFARSAAMAFNRYIDRNIDMKNPRTTHTREIPNGTIKATSALIFTIINCVLFIYITYLINDICLKLSPIALIIILGYSYTKRFTWLCHLILGLGLSLSPLAAYLAVTSEFNIMPILFSICVLFWVSGFDIIYSLQDLDFDRENKLYSIPAKIGIDKALFTSKLFHIISFVMLIIIGTLFDFQYWYWMGFVIFSSLLIYQHTLISSKNLERINLAFFTTNGIASLLLGLFVILDLII